jgi:hypothetical protein
MNIYEIKTFSLSIVILYDFKNIFKLDIQFHPYYYNIFKTFLYLINKISSLNN